MLPFAITNRDPESAARAGELTTPHGVVRTPAFMPVGTAGTVKGVAAWELERLAPEIVLANTYHLLLRPGIERLERLGGLHRLMGWPGPILTDSGRLPGLTRSPPAAGSTTTASPSSRTSTAARTGSIPRAPWTPRSVSGWTSRWCSTSACPSTPSPRWWSAPQGGRWHGRCAGCAGPGQRRQGGAWGGGLFAIQQGGADPSGPWPLQRGARRAPFRRLRRRGPGGGRAPTAAARLGGGLRPVAAGRPPSLPDGGGLSGGPAPRGGLRGRPLRLRAADPLGAHRQAVHVARRAEHQERPPRG